MHIMKALGCVDPDSIRQEVKGMIVANLEAMDLVLQNETPGFGENLPSLRD